MRLSWAVLSSQAIILMLSGLVIGMEIVAFLNDESWNLMIDNEMERFTLKEFSECKLYSSTLETRIKSDNETYYKVFKSKKRNLPFELPFLGLMCLSFTMYIIVMNIYIGWKQIMPNIYICIVSNLIGSISHVASFCLILTSTLTYSDAKMNYMGSPGCYAFKCAGCSAEDKTREEIAKTLYDEGRACLEKLHICQLSGFKDRIVFLILGCIIASVVALISSIRRLRRHKNRRIQPKQTFVHHHEHDISLHHTSMANLKRKSIPKSIEANRNLSDGRDIELEEN